jgi:hypothetical protein
MEDNILIRLTSEKTKWVREFLRDFLGHEPSSEERKLFTIMHGLSESRVYYKGRLVANVEFEVSDLTIA